MCNSLCRDFEKNLLPSSDPPVSVTAVENGLPIAQKSGYIILALPTGNTVISFQNPGSDALMRTLRDYPDPAITQLDSVEEKRAIRFFLLFTLLFTL